MQEHFWVKVLFTMIVTTILCSAIGLEREHTNRPAGVRTHMLVGLSSALVMLTSEFVILQYQGSSAIDPTRMGAQVISGIGFLGAGTIIKEGYNVKGLTTAASLWSVACIGLATGSGFYSGAIILTIVVLIALQFMRKLFPKHSQSHVLVVFLTQLDNTVESVRNRLEDYHLFIHEIKLIQQAGQTHPAIKFILSKPPELNDLTYIISRIEQIDGVIDVYLK